MDATNPYKFTGFGAMGATKLYNFIGFGAMDASKPYKVIGFGAMDVTLQALGTVQALAPAAGSGLWFGGMVRHAQRSSTWPSERMPPRRCC